jgi:aromatic-L-amino-acid decarboxylase
VNDEAFRAAGHELVDWIADYWRDVASLPVASRQPPGALRAALPPRAPEEPEAFGALLADVERLILPGLTHWQSPNFFAFFPANASGPAVLGELLSAGLGVQGMLWATSPACTELESHVLDWLADLLGLPETFTTRTRGGGVIQDSASSATLCALIAARERLTAGASNREGLRHPPTVYASREAHSSVEKAVAIAGIGRDNLRKIAVDENFALEPAALADAIRADREAGRTPCFAVATIGTTSSAAIDPLPEIAEICAREGVWLHVDAAYAGSAAICPEHRALQAGLAGADSYCMNPHKWLLTNFDCDAFFVKERAALTEALAVNPVYLKNRASDAGEVIDYRDWQISLGRRFRALKLWFVLRSFGATGLRAHVRRHVELATAFAGWVEDDPAFELAAPPRLGLVCFRFRGSDAENDELLERLNASGALYLTATRLQERAVLRLAVGGTFTEARHVEEAWRRIRSTAAALTAERV